MATHVVRAQASELSFLIRERLGALKDGIERAQLDAALATEKVVSADAPVDTGLYKNAWEVRRVKDGVDLHNSAPHAGLIENGTRPFTPPFQPIFEWAQRKAGDLAMAGIIGIGSQAFRKTKTGFLRFKGSASLDDDDLEAVRAFAWGVVRKIAREGLRPKKVMANRLEFARAAVQRAFEEFVLPRIARDPRPKPTT